MAAKGIKDSEVTGVGADATIDPKSIELGAQDWAVDCGVCHAGGGQMEYDRDMQPYSASSASGDANVFSWKNKLVVGGALVQQAPGAGFMSNTNKAEVDCLMCHMTDSDPGVAWYASAGCNGGNPFGPMADRNCDGDSNDAMFGENPMFGAAVVAFTPGTSYDLYNRNAAIKIRRLDLAATAGIGATLDLAGGTLTGVPTQILATSMSGTPTSKACSVCHARNDDTVAIPGMMGMRTGYGNFWEYKPAGTQYDVDDYAFTGMPGTGDQINNSTWYEFGCKTGMGKRGHRIGAGPNDKWGMSLMSMMFGLGKMPGAAIQNETIPATLMGMPFGSVTTKERIPDEDVHDAFGMQCATCHYALGGKDADANTGTCTDLNGVAATAPDVVACTTDANCAANATADYCRGTSREFDAVERHGVEYDKETVKVMDHQFAQADSYPDTKSKNNLDGVVSCESCHTVRNHPNLTDNGGTLVAPTPAHADLPAFHLDKIACTTCHIPEVYAAPGRLKYRDWTVGIYKGGFRNMLDWSYDMVTGSHTTMPLIRAWYHDDAKGLTQIKPYLPSIMPIWVESLSVNGSPTKVTAPIKARENQKAVAAYFAAQPTNPFAIRVNTGNNIPLFDGFTLADGWEIDTKAEIDAMIGYFNSSTDAKTAKLKLFQANFDITHGIVPADWALGGSKRGGCVNCHSSNNPMSPAYSKQSAGFFEGIQHTVGNADSTMMGGAFNKGTGQYDFIKNPFNIFADFDCNQFCLPVTTAGTLDAPMNGNFQPNANYNGVWDMFGNPVNKNQVCDAMSPLAMMNVDFDQNGSVTLGDCTALMAYSMDTMMGLPSGAAAMMGFSDGVAGIQGFTVKEGAPQQCNPFCGTVNLSPMNNTMGMDMCSVNACMPDAASCAAFDTMLGMPAGTFNGMLNGTCTGTGGMTGATCQGGFKNGAPCMTNAMRTGMGMPIFGDDNIDCKGTSNNMWLYSRDDARNNYKLSLQQSITGTGVSRVTWPIKTQKNPGNDNHVNSWDQANVCMNPAYGMPGQPRNIACANGGVIDTTMHMNKFLGYTDARLNNLMWGSDVAPPQSIPDVTPGDGDPTTSDFTNTVHCVDIDRDFECDDLDGDGVGDELPIASNLTLNPRMSVTASYYRNASGDVVPEVDKGIVIDSSRSLCDNTPCTYAWSYTDATGAPVTPVSMTTNAAGQAVAVMAAAGTYNVTLTITDAQSNVAWKTLKATAEDKNDAPTLTSVTAGVVGSTVTLTVVASDDAGVTSVFVDWNDGTSNTYPSASGISHNYSTTTGSGDYSIGVVVLDAKGLRTDARVNVTIQ